MQIISDVFEDSGVGIVGIVEAAHEGRVEVVR